MPAGFARYKHRTRLAATKASDAMHNITSNVRKCAAVDREMPTPLNKATYAATQAGHFGINTSSTPGTAYPATSPPRRHCDAGR